MRCASSRRRTRPRSGMRSRTASGASPAWWRTARPFPSMAEAAALVPAPAARPTPGALTMAAAPAQNLDDLMLAMDVVDTLRHQDTLVARELDEQRRDAE